jgi:hypothetical protein
MAVGAIQSQSEVYGARLKNEPLSSERAFDCSLHYPKIWYHHECTMAKLSISTAWMRFALGCICKLGTVSHQKALIVLLGEKPQF